MNCHIIQTTVLCAAIFVQAWGQGASEGAAQADQLLQQAQTLIAVNRLAEAEISLTQAVAQSPNDTRVITVLAQIKSRLGETGEAVKLFSSVVVIQPKSAKAHLNLAISLADDGNLNKALSQVDVAIHLEPSNADAYLNRARLLADLGLIEEARNTFAHAQRLAPSDVQVKLFWGLFEKQNHRTQTAESLLSQVIDLQPNNLNALLALADVQQSLGHNQEAIATWTRIVAIDPKSDKALYGLSLALRNIDSNQATLYLAQFKQLQVEKSVVEHVTEMGNEAYAAMKVQDWTTAVAKLQDAIVVCDQCALQADLHQRLGLAYCHRGDTEVGERELRLSLALNPNNRQTVEALQWVADHKTKAP
jgi:tetratricopeptide (TPR) repeat protein